MLTTRHLTIFAALLSCAIAAGCERPGDTPTNPAAGSDARQALERYLKAIQYGDHETAYLAHIASTPSSTWCTSEEFATILTRMKEGANEEECHRARVLTDARPEELDDDAMMLLQTMRFVCEQPEGRCHDYSKRVFLGRLRELDESRGALERYAIEQEHPDAVGDAATLYLDIDYRSLRPRKITVRVQKTPLGWRVTGPPGEL